MGVRRGRTRRSRAAWSSKLGFIKNAGRQGTPQTNAGRGTLRWEGWAGAGPRRHNCCRRCRSCLRCNRPQLSSRLGRRWLRLCRRCGWSRLDSRLGPRLISRTRDSSSIGGSEVARVNASACGTGEIGMPARLEAEPSSEDVSSLGRGRVFNSRRGPSSRIVSADDWDEFQTAAGAEEVLEVEGGDDAALRTSSSAWEMSETIPPLVLAGAGEVGEPASSQARFEQDCAGGTEIEAAGV